MNYKTDLAAANLAHEAKPLLVEPVGSVSCPSTTRFGSSSTALTDPSGEPIAKKGAAISDVLGRTTSTDGCFSLRVVFSTCSCVNFSQFGVLLAQGRCYAMDGVGWVGC